MIKTILLGIAILFASIMLMGIKIFFTKKGEFPNTHIGDSEAMKSRGISCASSQDRDAAKKVNLIDELLTEKL